MAQMLYMVLKAYPFSSLEAGGYPLKPAPGEPRHFVPVFDSEDKARNWAGDRDVQITALLVSDQPPSGKDLSND
jgi:hypothetical protein